MNLQQSFADFARALGQWDVVQRIGWMLLQSVWQGAAGALVLWVFLLMTRRSRGTTWSNVRYLASCLVLGAMTLAPLFSGAKPKAASNIPPMSVVSIPVQSIAPMSVSISAPVVQYHLDARDLVPFCVMLWCLGVLAQGFWQFMGWMRLGQLRRGDPIADPRWVTTLRRTCGRLGIHRRIALVCAAIDVPAVIGAFRPFIIVPAALLSELSPQQVEAVLAHELAHIRRWDYAVNLLQTAVETVFFYHPAVWWISRQIRREREHCCDDIAAELCGSPRRYAEALVALEEFRGRGLALACGMADGSLSRRIRRLLAAPPRRTGGMHVMIVGMIVIACGVAPFAFQHSAHAQTAATRPDALTSATTQADDISRLQSRLEQRETELQALRKSQADRIAEGDPKENLLIAEEQKRIDAIQADIAAVQAGIRAESFKPRIDQTEATLDAELIQLREESKILIDRQSRGLEDDKAQIDAARTQIDAIQNLLADQQALKSSTQNAEIVLQKTLAEKKSELATCYNQGFAENNPVIETLKDQINALDLELKSLALHEKTPLQTSTAEIADRRETATTQQSTAYTALQDMIADKKAEAAQKQAEQIADELARDEPLLAKYKSQGYGDDHPTIKALEAQIADENTKFEALSDDLKKLPAQTSIAITVHKGGSISIDGKDGTWETLASSLAQLSADRRHRTSLTLAAENADLPVGELYVALSRAQQSAKEERLESVNIAGINGAAAESSPPVTTPARDTPPITQLPEVYIGGEIRRPGVYSIADKPKTLRTLIVNAGDLSRGELARATVTLIRKTGSGEQQVLLKGAPLDPIYNEDVDDPILRPGDMVIVRVGDTDVQATTQPAAENAKPTVKVIGTVRDPAEYSLYSTAGERMTLTKMLIQAGIGGADLPRASVSLIRADSSGQKKLILKSAPLEPIVNGDVGDTTLQAGDFIVVQVGDADPATRPGN